MQTVYCFITFKIILFNFGETLIVNKQYYIFDFTAAGVVPCGCRKTSPRTSIIVQFIFYFGPLRSAISSERSKI